MIKFIRIVIVIVTVSMMMLGAVLVSGDASIQPDWFRYYILVIIGLVIAMLSYIFKILGNE